MDEAVGNIVRQMGSKVAQTAQEMATKFVQKIEEMKTKASEKMGQIKTTIETKMKEAGNQAKQKAEEMKQKVSQALEKMRGEASKKMPQFVTAVKTGFSNAVRAGQSFIGQAVGVGRQLIMGFVRGVQAAAGRLVAAASRAVGNAITAARNRLGVHSPSRVFKEIGMYTMKGLAIGFTDNADMAAKAMDKSIRPLTGQEISIGSNLDRINKQGNAAVDYVVSDKLGERKQSQTVILRLGNRDYKAFIDDISDAQGREIRLAEAYGI